MLGDLQHPVSLKLSWYWGLLMILVRELEWAGKASGHQRIRCRLGSEKMCNSQSVPSCHSAKESGDWVPGQLNGEEGPGK